MTTHTTAGQRSAKNALFNGFATIANALANGRRAEIVALLAQSERSVESIADSIDQSVGRLREHLQALGEWDNTIIVFTSDNGGSREGQDDGTSQYFRTLLVQTRESGMEDLAVDHSRLDLMGGPQTLPHYPLGWAMVSNTPLRMYKINTHQGGHQVPFIVHWPAGLDGAGEIAHREHRDRREPEPEQPAAQSQPQGAAREGAGDEAVLGAHQVQDFDRVVMDREAGARGEHDRADGGEPDRRDHRDRHRLDRARGGGEPVEPAGVILDQRAGNDASGRAAGRERV